MAARTLSAADFGAFGLAIAVYILVAGVCRSAFGEPLLTRHQQYSSPRRSGAAVTGGGLLVGFICAPLLLACSLALRGTPGSALAALSVVLPLVLMQDALRYHAIAQAHQARAVTIDALWIAFLAVFLAIYIGSSATITAPVLVLVWGAAGFGSYILPTLTTERFAPSPSGALAWCRDHSDLSGRYAAEFLTAGGVSYVALFALGATSGVVPVGSIRAVQSLLGPIAVLYAGSYLVLVPEGGRWLDRPRHFRFMMIYGSAGIALAAALWTTALLLVPDHLGEAALGSSWAGARRVLLPYGISIVIAGLGAGAVAGMRARSAARESLRARVISLPLVLIAPILGGVVGDEVGFSYGLIVGSLATSVVYWHQLARLTKQQSAAADRADELPPAFTG
ncbi:MAG: hypothetical protein ACR2LQ_13490 [Acidimicrobiales bacterium]